jgi:predicted RNA binding protein YcfA (HicA-like mRNA interferase family)
MKVRDVIQVLRDDGWYAVRTRGSHRQFKHPTKAGLVTVAGHPSKELSEGTLQSIAKQAQIGEI